MIEHFLLNKAMKEQIFLELIDRSPKIIRRKLDQLKFLRERPDFHPEESCYEHIKIVTTRLLDIGNPNLILAGVLHDICKFDCVELNKRNGYPTTPGHANEVKKLIEGNEDIKNWIISECGDVQKVIDICYFHMRFCNFDEMSEKKLTKYTKLLQENGVWDLLEIFKLADNMLTKWDGEEEKEKTLLLIRGLPGSGKTKLAKEICKGRYHAHFEADMYWDLNHGLDYNNTTLSDAHQFCTTNIEKAMMANIPLVVVSNTFTRASEMDEYFIFAKTYNYTVHTIIVENRHGGKNQHNVSDEKMLKMKNRFNIVLKND